jgi:hypothetical protein
MSELIVRDDGQLRRVETAIAAMECRSTCDQMRMVNLLQALYAERLALEVTHKRRRPRRH